MRRLARWMLNVVTVLLLLGCVATAVLWTRSRAHCDYARRVTRSGFYVAYTYPGGVRFMTFANRAGQPAQWSAATYVYGVPTASGGLVAPAQPPPSGFGLQRLSFNGAAPRPDEWEAFVPFWFVTATLAAAPVLAAGRSAGRWSRRRRRGRCPSCSYDLTGNQSGVCPECGTALPGKSA